MSVPEMFGWIAAAMLVLRMVPQAARVWRSGTSAGISPLGVLCWLGNDLGWLVYGLRTDLHAIWMASVVLVVCDMVLVASCAGRLRGPTLHAGGAWLVAVVAGAIAGTGPLAVVLVVGSATGTVPHAVHALRHHDLRGVSRVSWLVALVDAVAWGVYGAAHRDLPSITYAGLTALTAVIVVARVTATNPRPLPVRSLDPAMASV